MSTETPQLVDTTPISPTRGPIERRNSLEKHLTHRPEVQDLKNRNILLDTNAAPYVSKSRQIWTCKLEANDADVVGKQSTSSESTRA